MHKVIHDNLLANGKKLMLAESCTGGAVASLITKQAGCAKYFLGSIVAYSNDIKASVLNVSKESLNDNGAVSEEIAREMVLGLFKISDADYGVAITGIAGPSGGSEDKPVGTVFIAVAVRGEDPRVKRYGFSGDRMGIINHSVEKALSDLVGILKNG